ncbi:5078_t:CDS:10 [Cetraspora pellucida]|uniref:5078_t:CDS:1 n=1 Tax=Cetraspora pellucida TaxID=1433469 RepID=A0ACA9L438_9GLOM|nr:5078_t:CDS:10 [Cetraspora pellucida]
MCARVWKKKTPKKAGKKKLELPALLVEVYLYKNSSKTSNSDRILFRCNLAHFFRLLTRALEDTCSSFRAECNAQDRESSFNVDDDTVDGQGVKISRIDGNSIECDYSVSQPLEVSEIIQKNKAQNLNSNNQEPIEFESNEYDDTDEKRDEMIFDVLTSSLEKSKETSSAKSSTYKSQDNTAKHKSKTNKMFKVAKKYDKDDNRGGIECIPSTLTDDSPLPSEKETDQSFTTKDISKEASTSSSKSWQPNRNNVLSITSIINNQSDVGNIENERTSIINEEANEEYVKSTIICVPSDLPFVLINDPIPDEVSAQEMESSFDVEDDTVDGQGAGRKITQKFKVSKKPNKIDFSNKHVINGSSDLGSNDLQIESTAYSKCLKSPSYYAERLNELRKRKGMSNNFVSNTNDLVGICSQPIVIYFNEDSTQVLLEPLPKQMKDVGSCLNYLQSWEQHFEHCQKEIINQQYKMLKLIYSLSDFFFILLILCQQEQQEEMSPIALERTTDNWKGNDLKARINKKFINIDSRSILRKWTACWKLHHFLWVTNVTSNEMIEVKLNAKYFFSASESEYNCLIKELFKNPEFSEFHNIKGEKILELVNIAKNAYTI